MLSLFLACLYPLARFLLACTRFHTFLFFISPPSLSPSFYNSNSVQRGRISPSLIWSSVKWTVANSMRSFFGNVRVGPEFAHTENFTRHHDAISMIAFEMPGEGVGNNLSWTGIPPKESGCTLLWIHAKRNQTHDWKDSLFTFLVVIKFATWSRKNPRQVYLSFIFIRMANTSRYAHLETFSL